MCPNPTLFDFMEMKPQHYLHGKNCIQTRQGCSGESGPVTPHVSVALVCSIALVSLTPHQTFRHSIELTLFSSPSLPGMENLCPEKENTYAGTSIPDFCMGYAQISCALDTAVCSGRGIQRCFAVTDTVSLGPLGQQI